MKCRIILIASLLAAVTLTGCGGGKSAGKRINGTWVTNCQVGTSSSMRDFITFNGDSFTGKTENFVTSDCSGTATISDLISGTFKTGSSVSLPEGGTELTLSFTQPSIFTSYDVYKIEGNAISFGLATAEKDRSAADKRPIAWDSAIDAVFYKQ